MSVCSPPFPGADGRVAPFADRHRGGELDAHRHAGVSQLQPDKSHGRPRGAARVLQSRQVRLTRSNELGETLPGAEDMATVGPVFERDFRLLPFQVLPF